MDIVEFFKDEVPFPYGSRPREDRHSFLYFSFNLNTTLWSQDGADK